MPENHDRGMPKDGCPEDGCSDIDAVTQLSPLSGLRALYLANMTLVPDYHAWLVVTCISVGIKEMILKRPEVILVMEYIYLFQ